VSVSETTGDGRPRLRYDAASSRASGPMKTIFVMMKCELGKAYKVAEEAVETVEQVSEVYSVSGQYDLLMKCYLADEMDIGHFVVEHLQKLPDVKDTFTIMAYKAFSEDKSY
jgi:DNA-binding Lrp family transcriptional regulator